MSFMFKKEDRVVIGGRDGGCEFQDTGILQEAGEDGGG